MRIGILGYGNLGRGVELAIKDNPDTELVAVFTRRDPSTLKINTPSVPVVNVTEIADWKDKIDVLILCGGSATDLPIQTPEFAKLFNVVDSFDTHAKIPQHFANVDKSAKEGGKVAVISVGWDPGLFSLARIYFNAVLPEGKDYTFWGKGVSQGHSDAIRRIKGVKNAKQYTIPVDAALEAVRSGSNPELTTRQKHTRECFAEVVFEAHGKKYLASWSQHKASSGKLQAVKHLLSDAESGEILPERDIPETVEKITGMDFKRFTQALPPTSSLPMPVRLIVSIARDKQAARRQWILPPLIFR